MVGMERKSQVEKDIVKAVLQDVEASNRREWRHGVLGFHHK